MGENVERIRQGIELFNQGKIRELMDLYDNAVEVESAGSIIGGAFRGKQGLAEWFQKIGNTFTGGVHLRVENLYEAGDTIVVEWSSKAKLASGKEFEGKALNIFEFRGDKIAKHRLYSDTEQLAKAVGEL